MSCTCVYSQILTAIYNIYIYIFFFLQVYKCCIYIYIHIICNTLIHSFICSLPQYHLPKTKILRGNVMLLSWKTRVFYCAWMSMPFFKGPKGWDLMELLRLKAMKRSGCRMFISSPSPELATKLSFRLSSLNVFCLGLNQVLDLVKYKIHIGP